MSELPIGARLVVKCKKNWRGAVVSKRDEEKITLIVCSTTGGTYRLRRLPETILLFDGDVPILPHGCEENWRGNFIKYDLRW
ncbi:MAG: hypothetical protein ACR2L1_06055 [Pyrinomonadaceae bacterium]